jgi:predicted MFS family arabinose efflux permease
MTVFRGSHAPTTVLICDSAILAISLGVRHAFGLFLQPFSVAGNWNREIFAFAIALQNLVWGVSQPFAGLLADRFGAGKIVAAGSVLYAFGLVAMSQPHGQVGFIAGAGVLVGLGLSGTTYPLVLGAVSRSTSTERRSLALGIAMAGAAFGQFLFLPLVFAGIETLGWSQTLVTLAVFATAMLPLAIALSERHGNPARTDIRDITAAAAFRMALRHRSFQLLALGFFVCGFQVVFVATHVPAFLVDKGLSLQTGSVLLALIGLLNIPGTYYAGLWGGRYRKTKLLSLVYLSRGAIIAAFAFLPASELNAYAFGAAMGLFWLSTVPLTTGTVATLFGVKNMAMLSGIVFLAHQIGGFLGAWAGGLVFDWVKSYDFAWTLMIALSLLAALVNLQIKDSTGTSEPTGSRP